MMESIYIFTRDGPYSRAVYRIILNNCIFGHFCGYCQLNLNYSDFIENSGSSKLRINTLQVYF